MSRLTRRALLALALSLSVAPVWGFDARTFTDATGRTIEVPANPARVFAAGPPAATLLYTLKPEAMIGWVRPIRPEDKPFLLPETRDLPDLGRLTGRGDTLNLEVLLTHGPDLVVDYGTVNATYSDLAGRVQEQTGLPFVLVDGSFDNMAASIRQMADLLAVPERGAELADYVDETLAELDSLLASIPQAARPRIYLARGPEGIETAGPNSITAEIISRVGAVNVVTLDSDGLANVSPEQVQAWAPDVIITLDPDFAANVHRMREWQGIPAVSSGRVYLAPQTPFGFIDAPPSVNRLAGVIWLSHKLYPEAAEGDPAARIADFYELFYGLRPDDAAMAALLGE